MTPRNIAIHDFCEAMPKIELHAHLNGSLSQQTLKYLGANDDDISAYELDNSSIKNLDECFKCFKSAHDVTNSLQAIYLTTKNVLDDFHRDNVVYLELRTTPRSVDGMSSEDYIESIVKAIIDSEHDIIVKLIFSLNRQHDLCVSSNNLDVVIKMREKYPSIIKGVDLCGDPKFGCFNKDLFRKAREHNLHTTIHCGEIINNDEVREILEFQPDRLGHATCLHPQYGGTKENWDLLKQYEIPAEICLTSNVMCKTSTSYGNHHVKEWIKNDLPFSLNTDNVGVFSTKLSKEYNLAYMNLGLSYEDLWNISYNSIQHIFGSEEEKLLLQDKLNKFKIKNLDV